MSLFLFELRFSAWGAFAFPNCGCGDDGVLFRFPEAIKSTVRRKEAPLADAVGNTALERKNVLREASDTLGNTYLMG